MRRCAAACGGGQALGGINDMNYDGYDNKEKNDSYDTGYANVGSSGTNSANKYEEAGTGSDDGYGHSNNSSYGTGSSDGYGRTGSSDGYGRTGSGNDGYGRTGSSYGRTQGEGYGSSSSGNYRQPGSGNTGSYGGGYRSSYGGQTGYGSSYGSSQSRPHYTSYQDANYRAPGYNPGNQKPKSSGGKKKSFWKKAVAAILVGVLLGGSAAGAFYGVYRLSDMDDAVAALSEAKEIQKSSTTVATTTAKKPDKADKNEEVREAIATTSGGERSVSQVVEDVMPAVVAITNAVTMRGQTWWGQTIERTGESAGSGIIVGENDDELLIVTNQHVISDATTLSVQFVDGGTAEANLKGQDEAADIAVIAVAKNSLSGNTADKIKIATLGDSDSLQVGEQVVAIGNAMGYGQSTTTGIISALGREAEFSTGSHELIQTDAAINPGNSGGALLNMEGELIGINEAKAGQVLSNGTIVEGMGYAIPISAVQPIIDELMNKETKTKASEDKQSYLGIGGVDVTQDVSSTYDIPEGIYVAQVESGSAADEAGLERGDVIVKFDGESVSSMEELKDLMQYYEAGATVDITIKKQSDGGYDEKTISVKLGKRPAGQ